MLGKKGHLDPWRLFASEFSFGAQNAEAEGFRGNQNTKDLGREREREVGATPPVVEAEV